MQIDLNAKSKKELEKLRADVDKALESLEARKKADALRALEDAAKKHGYSLGELVSPDGRRTKGKKTVSPPKYQNPDDPLQTWTGRGRQPGWIKDGLAAGKSLSDFEI